MPHDNYIIRYEKALLIAVLLELFLGGNGYLTEIGGVRLRVILSAICVLWATVRLSTSPDLKLPSQIWGLLLLFIAITLIGILIGLVNGNEFHAIAAELKALLYFPMILFFAVAIRSKEDISLVTRLIIMCGVTQAILYLSVLALVHSGKVSYTTVYLFLQQSDEFIFRHNPDDVFFLGFFYKGAFHMCVAAIFLLLDPVRNNKYLAAIALSAIVLTLTRGLMLALIMSLIFGVLLMPKRKWISALAMLGTIVVAVFVFTDALDLIRRPASDQIRFADMNTIRAELNTAIILFGKGMGAVIGGRERIEITYLEILYKQGIIGLSLWMAVLYTNIAAFRRVSSQYRQHALVFCLATVYVYLATATNTFLTGSIGMSVVLLSTVILLVMNRETHPARAAMARSHPSTFVFEERKFQ